jgi:16S rRNA processing protein RimM
MGSGKSGVDSQWAWLARIGKTQGRMGEVLCELLTDFPEKFAERKRVWLLAGETESEAEVQSHWMHKGCVVLKFAGIDSMTAAEALRGQIVAIPRTERAPLGDDEVYAGDLIGCELVDVRTETAKIVGVIEDVDREAGPVALLVVAGAAGGEEILVPFAKAYLRRIDLDGKRVEMSLPEGLLEL